MSSNLHLFQPLNDPRWGEFLGRHTHASVFHTAEWLEALRRTYNYEPVGITTSPPNAELRNAAVFCRVKSWITGRRLVSLPFSDHTELLLDDSTDGAAFVTEFTKRLSQETLRYIELRPLHTLDTARLGIHATHTYCLHKLDLVPCLESLYTSFHKNSTQRKIRRAERSKLVYEEGRSRCLLDAFYQLLILTRRRHNLPPQPKSWFENLTECFGSALKIRTIFLDNKPVAAILTLQYKDTLVYKYGCSDARFHHVGGMPFLFWASIQEAKREGLLTFDLGRTDWDNKGLLTFKDRLGAARSAISCFRLFRTPQPKTFTPVSTGWKQRLGRKVLPYLPDRWFCLAGELMYRHVG